MTFHIEYVILVAVVNKININLKIKSYENKKNTVVCIYNNIGYLKAGIIGMIEHLGFHTETFLYPEDFEECLKEKRIDIKDIKLILLGQSFPGDGSKQRESGPSRGILFLQRFQENNTLEKIHILIPCEILKDEYLKKLKEYGVSLKEKTRIIDLFLLYESIEKILKT